MLIYIHNEHTFILERDEWGVCMYINKIAVLEAMSKKGIKTQTELAQLMNITKNQLSVMLSEKFDPIKSNVAHLCTLLEISPIDILTTEDAIKYKEDISFLNEIALKYEIKRDNTVKAIELFAGTGGIALGLEQAGIDTIAHVEIDRLCCATLRRNRPLWNVIEDDIANVDFTSYKGQVQLVTGGFPCQAFSYAGKKLGFEDTRGTLFHQFARCIKEVDPLMFMAENVRGLISHDDGRTLETILDVLKGLGYNVEYRLLNAVNYGVPQKRERIVIIGTKPDITFYFPQEERKIRTLRDALKGVPNSEGQQYSSNKKQVLDLVPPGGCWRNLPLEIQKSYMGKSYFSGGGRTGMARRISWDEPCLTLTCSPSQKQTERCHPDETRPFTVREYARIQTFPDNWEFVGGLGEKYKQIGNAVPVRLAFKLGTQIVDALQSDYMEMEG